MNPLIQSLSQWVVAHPTTVLMGAYYVFSTLVSSFEMPTNQSSASYRVMFKFFNALAANLPRAQASTTNLGYQDPKLPTIPGPEVAPPPKETK